MAYENVVADRKTKHDTKSKVVGYLKKLKSYRFLCLVACYLDTLEIIMALLEKFFERECLLPFEVYPLLTETISNIDDTIAANVDEDMLVSHLASYRIVDGTLSSQFLQADDNTRDNASRARITVSVFHEMDEPRVKMSL